MRIARVVGSAVSTVKEASLVGHKLLLVREADETGEITGPVFVAVDASVRARESWSWSPRAAPPGRAATTSGQPVDAVIMGILDSLEVGGTVTFRKS